MQREGWQAAVGKYASCAVVVWSEHSVGNGGLAAAARPFLDRRKLLQILWRPPGTEYSDQNRIEAPDPFHFYESLVVQPHYLDGSERAVDELGAPWEYTGEQILSELARLGGLPRPRDSWNAEIVFQAPLVREGRQMTLVELAGDCGRVLRRIWEDGRMPDSSYQTTIGNRWQILDRQSGQLLQELVVSESDTSVTLPERERWWRGWRSG